MTNQTVNINISYAARQDTRYNKAYKSCVWINGKPHYHTYRAKKTFNSALTLAKSLAEGLGKFYTQQNVAYEKYIINLTEIK